MGAFLNGNYVWGGHVPAGTVIWRSSNGSGSAFSDYYQDDSSYSMLEWLPITITIPRTKLGHGLEFDINTSQYLWTEYDYYAQQASKEEVFNIGDTNYGGTLPSFTVLNSKPTLEELKSGIGIVQVRDNVISAKLNGSSLTFTNTLSNSNLESNNGTMGIYEAVVKVDTYFIMIRSIKTY
ncbi:hypothetical protein [Lentilactobacillus senioris]|uniref:hypothetical protein n=1 Tax=Lentilactobacillus senioris TaxID=931534 RepID=UPI003D2AD94B